MEGLLRRTLTSAVEIDLDLSVSLWSALVDEAQLESTILNLAINARDAMSETGGSLVIGTENVTIGENAGGENDVLPAGRYVLLTVSDTGCGMTPEIMGRVFEPFFTTKPVGQGSGLGLSMVYGFVKQSDGYVRLSSVPGHGTTVSIYLPQTDEAIEARPVEEPAPARPAAKGRILLVEDDDMVREHVQNQIKALGYDVEAANSGADALERLRADSAFDLVLTDIVMAGDMNGYQLAESVAAIQPSLPFLFTSGYTQDMMPSHGRFGSGADFLKKPYRRDALASKIARLLKAD
jgi:CheY-like chemotaxis protein